MKQIPKEVPDSELLRLERMLSQFDTPQITTQDLFALVEYARFLKIENKYLKKMVSDMDKIVIMAERKMR